MSSGLSFRTSIPSNRIEPGDDLAGRVGHKAGDREGRDALSTAGFADEAECLSVADIEADIVDGLDDPVRREEMGRQAPDLEQVVGLRSDARLRDHLCPRPQDVVGGHSDDRRGVGVGHVLLQCLAPIAFP